MSPADLTDRIDIDGPEKEGDVDVVPMFKGVKASVRGNDVWIRTYDLAGVSLGMDVRHGERHLGMILEILTPQPGMAVLRCQGV